MQIEQRAEKSLRYCAALQKDFSVFREDFDLVGKHLSNAQGKYASAEKRLDRFETKLDQAADEQAELPAAATSGARRGLEPDRTTSGAGNVQPAEFV